MINKKWIDQFGLALYWIVSILWIVAGIFFNYYYYHTQEGIESLMITGV